MRITELLHEFVPTLVIAMGAATMFFAFGLPGDQLLTAGAGGALLGFGLVMLFIANENR